jgi:hypothetical protein
VVALLMNGLERGDDISGSEAYRQAYPHLRNLLAALVRAVLIVGVLMLSVVGIPWGIRQFVRYQFLAETTTLEPFSGQAALDRSTQLVRRRWFHTLVVLFALSALVFLFAVIVGLLLLIVFAGIPLWLFSIFLTAFAALLVPYTAIAATLLYGDARAEREAAVRAEMLEPVTA